MSRVLSPREILDRLVSFPTVSRDSNLDLIDWVEAYLASHGIEATRVPSPDGTKSALFALGGAAEPGGVILSGHTDVVPVDGQDWHSDPFSVTERDGKLYGRGCVDMKGFDAIAIWACVEAQRQGLARPVQLALSYDEEVGIIGCEEMIAAMREALPPVEGAIIGEPSMMQVVTGHKGGAGYNVDVRGFEVHSSLQHTGVNAIMEGARLIQWVNDRNEELAAAEPGPLAAMFEPPFTTIHIGVIEGGTAHNITALDCHFAVSFRCVPGDEMSGWDTRLREAAAAIDARMKAVRPSAGITLTERFSVPPLEPEEQGRAEALARALTGDNGTHVVSYGTEAGHFQNYGYSAVVCGPGSIEQAHQPDEYITVEQFEAGIGFARDLLRHLSA